MAKKWKKLEANSGWKFKEEKELVGVYVSMEENVGPNNSKLYTIEREDGSRIGVWGNTMLDDKFKDIEIGTEIKIVYLGLVESEKTGREYNNFDIFLSEGEDETETDTSSESPTKQKDIPF